MSVSPVEGSADGLQMNSGMFSFPSTYRPIMSGPPPLLGLADQYRANFKTSLSYLGSILSGGSVNQSRNQILQNAQQGGHFDRFLKGSNGSFGIDKKEGDFENINSKKDATQNPVPLKPLPEPQLKAPNAAQLAVGGLFALLAPKYAAMALTAPFQAGLDRHAQELQRYQIETAKRERNDLETKNGEEAKKADEVGRIFDGIQAAKTLDDLDYAISYLDARGYGERLSEYDRRRLRKDIETRSKLQTDSENEAKLDEFLWAVDNLDAAGIDKEDLIKNGKAMMGQFQSGSTKALRLQGAIFKLERDGSKRTAPAKQNGFSTSTKTLALPVLRRKFEIDLGAFEEAAKAARRGAYGTIGQNGVTQDGREAIYENAIRTTQANIAALEGELRRQWSSSQAVSTLRTRAISIKLDQEKTYLDQLWRLLKTPEVDALGRATNTPSGGHRGLPKPPYSST